MLVDDVRCARCVLTNQSPKTALRARCWLVRLANRSWWYFLRNKLKKLKFLLKTHILVVLIYQNKRCKISDDCSGVNVSELGFNRSWPRLREPMRAVVTVGEGPDTTSRSAGFGKGKNLSREKEVLSNSTPELWISTTEMGPSLTQTVFLLAALCAQVSWVHFKSRKPWITPSGKFSVAVSPSDVFG